MVEMGQRLLVVAPLAAAVFTGCFFRRSTSGNRTGDAPPADGLVPGDGVPPLDGAPPIDGDPSIDGRMTGDAIGTSADPCATAMPITTGPGSCDANATGGSNSVVAMGSFGDVGCTWPSVMLAPGASGMNPNFVVRVTEAPAAGNGAAFVQATLNGTKVRIQVISGAGGGFTASAGSGWTAPDVASGTVQASSMCLRVVEQPSIDSKTHAQYYDPMSSTWMPLAHLDNVFGNPVSVKLGVTATNTSLVQAKLDDLGSGTL